MFTADICKELQEEVGLGRPDLEWIVPVALCREFLRGGKPQLFYCAFTNLRASELPQRLAGAIKKQIERGRQELRNEWLICQSPEQLYEAMATHGTIEGLVNLTYTSSLPPPSRFFFRLFFNRKTTTKDVYTAFFFYLTFIYNEFAGGTVHLSPLPLPQNKGYKGDLRCCVSAERGAGRPRVVS